VTYRKGLAQKTFLDLSSIMNWQDYIIADPQVLVGKAVLKGTRLSVEFLLGLIADGWSEQEILSNYRISKEQLRACAAYAQARVSEERVLALTH
jgi:uncharacterized protein (DUF433 family)